MSPNYKGYVFKDAYEFFKNLSILLHEEFKFLNKKKYDMKKVFINEIDEEWDILKNY